MLKKTADLVEGGTPKVSVHEDYSESFPNMGRGVLLNRQVDKFTKSFLVCQIHFEVPKHVSHQFKAGTRVYEGPANTLPG